MKIFFILNDSVPYGSLLDNYFDGKGFTKLTQISNCFTTTSVVSLLTGKMPSDLVPGGIAYHTHYRYKTDGIIDYPWKHRLLLKKLYDKGWIVYINNASWFYLTICADNYICKSTSLDCGLHKADEFKATKEFTKILLTNTTENNAFYSRNKRYIQAAQKDVDVNEFYFIKNLQYHQALATGESLKVAIERIKLNLDYIDFDAPDSIFYIFSDHDNFLEIDKLCRPPNCLTTGFIKDNTRKTFNEFPYINISDMFNYILTKKLPAENRNRIYFAEDARVHIDPENSTTAVACKFIDWDNGMARKLLQVSYFRPENKYYGFIYDLMFEKLIECPVDTALKQELKERFEWVK
ncbi:hypothetical protein LCGC14_0306190 [marine sediment metagenome]|uniref:Sulfatase N-terminal domain-containing protein n=1 Tax=marine sediment metagenome TaxID=412755 RepID=A0A0F9TP15_9ZZZZ